MPASFVSKNVGGRSGSRVECCGHLSYGNSLPFVLGGKGIIVVGASESAILAPILTHDRQAAMTAALIQAGGESRRMRRTFGATHKSLLPVLGVSLLERNLCQLLAAGLDHLILVTAAAETEVQDYVATRGTALAKSRGARLECLVETEPLGTIGAAGKLASRDCPILVVYADNLTSLDFNAVLSEHVGSRAAMILAVHEHPFQIPFGEVVCRDGHITDYLEKSTRNISISSGIYVLGEAALAEIPNTGRCDSPQVVHRLLAKQSLVKEFRHNALWIDVNDVFRLTEADLLVAKNGAQLDQLSNSPAAERSMIVQMSGSALEYTVCEHTHSSTHRGISLAVFDEIDPASGEIVRWRVEWGAPPRELTEIQVSSLRTQFQSASAHVRRAIAHVLSQSGSRP